MTNALTRWDALKLIALLLMFVDHAGAFFYTDEEWLRGIRRACAPLFLFLVGFAPHYHFDKKLFVFALLLSGFDWWVQAAPNTLNILFSIILIRLLLARLEAHDLLKLQLHEWVIGSLALIPSVVVVQYGSFGLLFALSGFVFKHRAHYAPRTPVYFLAVVTLLYGVIIPLLSEFSIATCAVTAASLTLMCWLIQWFVRAPKEAVSLPAACKILSHYTAEIYVLHLVILIGLTGKAL